MALDSLPSLDSVRAQLGPYLLAHPEERDALAPLIEQLDACADDASLFARSNMVGHVTSSVMALDEEAEHLLLIEHLHHQSTLPPGGHVEMAKTLIESALREGDEETGLQGAQPHPLASFAAPFDVDSHPISPRPAKGEGAHRHHDFLYLAVAKRFEPRPQQNEVAEARWVPIVEAAQLPHPRVRKLVAKLRALDPRVERLFSAEEARLSSAALASAAGETRAAKPRPASGA
jgi:8-oxo-dGTP pyrophosphatase MutT (NUDIX family)